MTIYIITTEHNHYVAAYFSKHLIPRIYKGNYYRILEEEIS